MLTPQSFLPWKTGGEEQARNLRLQTASKVHVAFGMAFALGRFMTWEKKKKSPSAAIKQFIACAIQNILSPATS